MIFVILINVLGSVIIVPVILAHTVRLTRLIVAQIVLRIPVMIILLIIRKTTLTSLILGRLNLEIRAVGLVVADGRI